MLYCGSTLQQQAALRFLSTHNTAVRRCTCTLSKAASTTVLYFIVFYDSLCVCLLFVVRDADPLLYTFTLPVCRSRRILPRVLAARASKLVCFAVKDALALASDVWVVRDACLRHFGQEGGTQAADGLTETQFQAACVDLANEKAFGNFRELAENKGLAAAVYSRCTLASCLAFFLHASPNGSLCVNQPWF